MAVVRVADTTTAKAGPTSSGPAALESELIRLQSQAREHPTRENVKAYLSTAREYAEHPDVDLTCTKTDMPLSSPGRSDVMHTPSNPGLDGLLLRRDLAARKVLEIRYADEALGSLGKTPEGNPINCTYLDEGGEVTFGHNRGPLDARMIKYKIAAFRAHLPAGIDPVKAASAFRAFSRAIDKVDVEGREGLNDIEEGNYQQAGVVAQVSLGDFGKRDQMHVGDWLSFIRSHPRGISAEEKRAVMFAVGEAGNTPAKVGEYASSCDRLKERISGMHVISECSIQGLHATLAGSETVSIRISPDDYRKLTPEEPIMLRLTADWTPKEIPDGTPFPSRNPRIATTVLDRRHPALQPLIEEARKLKSLPRMKDRADKVAEMVREALTPPDERTRETEQAWRDFEASRGHGEIQLGDYVRARAGVCKQRSMLTYVLGEAAGMQISTERGEYWDIAAARSGGHALNRARLGPGEYLLIDAMNLPESQDLKVTNIRGSRVKVGYASTTDLFASGTLEASVDAKVESAFDVRFQQLPDSDDLLLLLTPRRGITVGSEIRGEIRNADGPSPYHGSYAIKGVEEHSVGTS